MSDADYNLRSAVGTILGITPGQRLDKADDLIELIQTMCVDQTMRGHWLDAMGLDIDAIYEALGLTVRRMVMPSPGGVTGSAYGIVDFIHKHPHERVDFVVRPRQETV